MCYRIKLIHDLGVAKMTRKVPSESVNLTKENIKKLKELFPEILTDGEKINFDLLKTVLGEEVEDNNERYSFNWHGKKASILGAQKPSKGTLRPVEEKSKNFDETENLYIEGDNLEALKLLQKSYSNKVKVIYIDPPYNTGNDFVYKDDFKSGVDNYMKLTGQIDDEGNTLSTNSESNGRYHTDWLNMMYPRLKLAKNLLADDGVIFVSIDDNEHSNLKKICDELFGENNLIANFIITRSEGGGLAKQAVIGHDYLLAYSKDIEKSKPLGRPKDIRGKVEIINGEEYWLETDWLRREFGKYGTLPYEEIESVKGLSKKIEIDKGIEKGIYKLIPRKDQHIVGRYRRVKDDTTKFYTIMKHLNKGGVNDLKDLKIENYFDYPKPTSLIKDFIFGATIHDSEGIILDFFSGSSTTAHATMQLNAEDGGERKFIMVQLPELLNEKSEAFEEGHRTICDIAEERIHRAGEKVEQDLIEKNNSSNLLDGQLVDPHQLDIGFKVLKLDKSNIREWNSDFDTLEENLDLFEEVFIEGRDELDVVYEIMLKNGLELTYPIKEISISNKNIYDVAYGNLFVCLDDEITLEIAQAIINKRDEYGIETSTVVFKDAGFAGNDSVKLNVVQLLKDAGYPEDNILTI